MKRKNIFDSKSEIQIYQHLDSIWSNDVMIAHHIPVVNVFPFEELKNHPSISSKDFDFLLKSSFDFVVASKQKDNYGTPLLVIEFDGFAGGFRSKEGYRPQNVPSIDEYRKIKLDCKVKVCELMEMPFVIVSYPEIEKVDQHLSVLDLIIGQVLANDYFDREFKRAILKNRRWLDRMPPEERQAYLNRIGDDLSTDAAFNYNPVIPKIWEMFHKLWGIASPVWTSLPPEMDGEFFVYSGFARLNVEFRHLAGEMDIFYGDEQLLESDSFSERMAKLMAKHTSGVLVRKKVKIRGVHCKGVNLARLAEDLAHYLILSEIAKNIEFNEG